MEFTVYNKDNHIKFHANAGTPFEALESVLKRDNFEECDFMEAQFGVSYINKKNKEVTVFYKEVEKLKTIEEEMAIIDKEIWKRYLGEESHIILDKENICAYLKYDIQEAILRNGLFLVQSIEDIINQSYFGETILKEKINMNEILEKVKIRNNFDEALKNKEPAEIASELNYFLTQEDISKLYELYHRKKKSREKVINLLTYCMCSQEAELLQAN